MEIGSNHIGMKMPGIIECSISQGKDKKDNIFFIK